MDISCVFFVAGNECLNAGHTTIQNKAALIFHLPAESV
jgi:hypothetical protein